MNGGTVTFHFTGDKSNLDKSLKNINSGLKGLTSKIAIGNIIATGVSKAFSVMSSHMDDAISRIDTMNNFPNVMKNLGISAKESEKSIKKISKGLEGLPTSLDAGAMAVQRFTSANNNISKSTDMFLALNNALLAGGASTEIQASALEQLSQAYAKGKPDMMEWRSLQTAMPAQLKQVASAFNMTSAELGEALRNGNISMDDFMNKIIELNKNGTGEFASFEKQARNSTNGLRTNITNLGTAITRGMANAFNSLNESLQKANLPTVQEMLKNLTNKITKGFAVFNDIVSKIPWRKVIKYIKIIGISFLAWKTATIIQSLVIGFQGMMVQLSLLKLSMGTTSVASAVLKYAMMGLNAVMAANPIALIVIAIIALIAIIVVLYKKCDWFRNAVNKIFKFIVTIFTNVINFVKNNWKQILLFLVNPFAGAFALLYKKCGWFRKIVDGFVKKIKSLFNNMKNGIVNAFKKAVDFIKTIPSKIASIPGKIRDKFAKLPDKFKTIGINMVRGLVKGVKNAKNMAINSVKDLGGKILGGIKKILGVHSPSTEFALIGKFSVLGFNEGLEKMQPELQRAINGMFNLSPSMTGTMNNTLSPNVNVTNNVNVETDPLGQVVSKIKTFSGGAKNDYNYGYGG